MRFEHVATIARSRSLIIAPRNLEDRLNDPSRRVHLFAGVARTVTDNAQKRRETSAKLDPIKPAYVYENFPRLFLKEKKKKKNSKRNST